jgi:rhodanese-related sulfurtransferase
VKGLRREPWEVLASRWDGTALALGLQPLGRWRLLGPVALRYAAIVLQGAVLMAGVWLALCRWRRLPRLRSTLRASVFEFVVLAILSGAVALLWHWLGPEGFLARTGATDHVRVARMGYFLPRVDRGGVSRVVEGKDRAVILDARDGESYYAGHIPGAINVPVDLNTALRVKKMGKTAKGERIIVYCGSEECGLARLMAASLYHAGYTNLQIYPGGWKEWDAWQETQAPRRGRVVNAGGVGLP